MHANQPTGMRQVGPTVKQVQADFPWQAVRKRVEEYRLSPHAYIFTRTMEGGLVIVVPRRIHAGLGEGTRLSARRVLF